MIKTIIVGSQNPVKIKASKLGFQQMFPNQKFKLEAVSVPSQVNDQPKGDQETLIGSFNRSNNAKRAKPEADFWVGIEGGIHINGNEIAAYAWIVVQSKNGVGKSRTGTFILPEPVAKLILAGKELGEADDIVFNQNNSKQNSGAVGLLTNDKIDRCNLYKQAVVLALIPLKNPELYSQTIRSDW